MSLTDSNFDDRAQSNKFPVAKINALTQHGAVSSDNTLTGTDKFVANGLVKAIKTEAPNLTTDTTFTVSIIDQDGAVVYLSSGIADNGLVVTRIVNDSAPLLCSGQNGYYQIKIDWTTAQNISANSFKTTLFMTNK